jgi:hypothetical protein
MPVNEMSGMGASSNTPGKLSQNSVASSKKSGKKERKKVDPISLEEVFNNVSIVTASNVNPPPGRLVLTPRSAEVCLKLGINPEVIKIRDIDSFWEPGIEPSVQRMRHEAYVKRRYDTMKQCRLERKRLINQEFEAATTLEPTSTLTPEEILEKQKEASSTLVQLEMARIAKMQKRQEKELEQMIQYEVSRAQVAQDMEKRLSEAKKKDEIRKKQQEKRLKLAAEERRLKEMQKAAMEEVEEENRRALAHDMHNKEMELNEQRRIKEERDKKRRRQMEVERKMKLEEQRAKVQKFFTDEQQRLRDNLATLHFAEEKKQAAMEAKQTQLAEDLRRKRDAIEKRIEENVKIAKMIDQKRKDDFEKKTEIFEMKRQEQLAKQDEERRLHAQEIMLQEQRRRMILIQKRKEEEVKAERMLEKFEEEEIHVMEVQEQRQKGHRMLKEKKDLRTQMKLENVARVHRVSEYKRMMVLNKIEEKDNKVVKMLGMKESMIGDRRQQANKTRLQKEKIAAVMDEVRTNATKAQKLITKAMSGGVTLDALIGDKNKKKKKKKKNGLATTSSLLEGSAYDTFEAADAPAEKRTYNSDGMEGAADSKAYQSPYDANTSIEL